MESNKLESVLNKFTGVNEAVEQLSGQLKFIPSFTSLLQDCLAEDMWRLVPELYISKVFINYRGAATAQEPTGSLNDVLMECLLRGSAPNYNPDQYGVYDWLNDTDESARYADLDVGTVSQFIAELLRTLPAKFVVALDQYWARNTGNNVMRKGLLRSYAVKLFWQELNNVTQEGGVTPADEKKIHALTSPLVPSAFYGVAVQLHDGVFKTLASAFVMRLDGQSSGAIVPAADSAMILYTANAGVEKFATSAALHQEVRKRLSTPASRGELLKDLAVEDALKVEADPGIRYPRIDTDVFGVGTDALLAKQRADISRQLKGLSGSRTDKENVIREVNALLPLKELLENAKHRTAALIKLISKNAWPEWLKRSSERDQKIYVDLERTLLQSEVDLHRRVGHVASLKAYTRNSVQDFIFRRAALHVDPDFVLVTLNYNFRMGVKEIRHQETKTLTELFMYGLHDKAARYQLKINGEHARDLTPSFIESAIETLDVRMKYAALRNAAYKEPEVQDAIHENLARVTALSVFAAGLQGHLKAQSLDMVKRCNLGDTSLITHGLSFRDDYQAFKELTVYTSKSNGALVPCVLYAPGAPGGKDWFEFDNVWLLKEHVAKWVLVPGGKDYLIDQCHLKDRGKLDDEINKSGAAVIAGQSSRINSVTWMSLPQRRFEDSVRQLLAWAEYEVEFVTPGWFRQAKLSERQCLARLSTEQSAIYELAKDKVNVQPFQVFARELVKKRVNDYLLRSGPHPEIDPDQVEITIAGHQPMTLTQLFINWEIWRSDTSSFVKALAWFDTVVKSLVNVHDLLRTATFRSRDGTSVGRLSAAVINDLIGVLPGDQYIDYLKSTFLNPGGGDLSTRPEVYGKLKQNKLQFDALTQRMQGNLSVEQYTWLNAVLEELHITANTANGEVYRFVVNGKRVEGGYVFARKGTTEKIIYLPAAYDGKNFVSLESYAAELKMHARWDIVKSVRSRDQEVVRNYLFEVLKGYHDFTLTLGRPIRFSDDYAPMIELFIAETDDQTTSLSEAFWRDTLIVAEFAVDIVSLLIPPVGVAATLLKATRSIVLGVIAHHNGYEKQASGHFSAAWVGLISLYVGTVAGIGGANAGLSHLSRINDFAGIVSTVTGVEVGVNYLTYVAGRSLASTTGSVTTSIR